MIDKKSIELIAERFGLKIQAKAPDQPEDLARETAQLLKKFDLLKDEDSENEKAKGSVSD